MESCRAGLSSVWARKSLQLEGQRKSAHSNVLVQSGQPRNLTRAFLFRLWCLITFSTSSIRDAWSFGAAARRTSFHRLVQPVREWVRFEDFCDLEHLSGPICVVALLGQVFYARDADKISDGVLGLARFGQVFTVLDVNVLVDLKVVSGFEASVGVIFMVRCRVLL